MHMPATKDFPGLRDAWLYHLTAAHSDNTVAAYRRDLNGVADCLAARCETPLAHLTIDRLTADVLRLAFADFAATRAKATVARAWSAWNSFFAHLLISDTVSGNPMGAVPRPGKTAPHPKPFRGEDTVSRLLTFLVHHGRSGHTVWRELDLLVITLALFVGARSAEMRAACLGDITGPAGARSIILRGKGDKIRVVALHPVVDLVLDLYLNSRREIFQREPVLNEALLLTLKGTPVTVHQLRYLVEQCYLQAGIADRVQPGACVHAMRHQFGTSLAAGGAEAHVIKSAMGHSDLETSQHYVETTGAQTRTAVLALPDGALLEQLLKEAA